MTLIWKPWYTTRDDTLDEQHRAIFELINRLGELVKAKRYTGTEIDRLLKQMGDQIDTHFALEEGCMARHACPMAEKNRGEHDQFRNIYLRFVAGYRKKKTLADLRKFHRLASDWLEAHICFVDIHLRTCIRHGPDK